MNTEQTVYDVAGAIAQHLPGWKAEGCEENRDRAELRHGSGAAVTLHRVWSNKRRIEAHGQYPRGSEGQYRGPMDWGAIRYDAKAPEITFDATRDPKALARDLERRLLPQYLQILMKCREIKKEYDAYHAKQEARLEHFAKLLGSRRIRNGTRDSSVHFHHTVPVDGEEDTVWGDVRMEGDTSRIEMSVPNCIAEKVLKLLAAEMATEQ
jgi:hypothetical protein